MLFCLFGFWFVHFVWWVLFSGLFVDCLLAGVSYDVFFSWVAMDLDVGVIDIDF